MKIDTFYSTKEEKINLKWFVDFEKFVKLVAPYKDNIDNTLLNSSKNTIDLNAVIKPINSVGNIKNLFQSNNEHTK